MPYKTSEGKRAYAQRRRELRSAENSAYYKAYYAAHREDVLAKNAAWRRTNSGNFRTNQGYRRMLIVMLVQRDGDRCVLCKNHLGGDVFGPDVTVEHLNPICDGGEMFSAENLGLSHRECNQTRRRGNWRQRGKE